MTRRFRIYTENRDNLPQLAKAHLSGFTITQGLGYFAGVEEHSAVIECLGTPADQPTVLRVAEDILDANAQTEVLVTSEPISSIAVRQQVEAA